MASSKDAFDFAGGVSSLGADYAYLNFVINWPLGMRLGVAPPQGAHNATHPQGLQQHLRWLAVDVAAALESLCGRAPNAKTRAVEAHLRALRSVCSAKGEAADPWANDLPKVRKAIAGLAEVTRNANLPSGASDRAVCNRFAMAAELLAQVSASRGTNFRRRATELLQLCILEHLLGVVPFFNCKSGIDRAGFCAALWTTVHQLMSRQHATLWEWYFFSLHYALLVNTAHRVDGCAMRPEPHKPPEVPQKQLLEEVFMTSDALLPFPPEEPQEATRYRFAQELFNLYQPNAKPQDARIYNALEKLFFAGPDALMPCLQLGFLANQLGVTVKVAAASTGVHGLKYGNCGIGQYNAIAAQFMPARVRCAENGKSVPICEVKKGWVASDVAFTDEIMPYIVGSSSGRGT